MKLSLCPSKGSRDGDRFISNTVTRQGGVQLRTPAAYHPDQESPVHWIRNWVGPRTGPDVSEKTKIYCLCRGLNPDSLGRPARSKLNVTVLRESLQDEGLCADNHENITGAQQVESLPFLGSIEILRKWVLVCPSARMKQIHSHWTDFNEIWYFRIFRKICRENSNFIKI